MADRKALDIRELAEQAKREGAVDLAQGIIDLPPPQVLIENLKRLPLERYSKYNNKRGVPEYREAIRSHLASREWNTDVNSIMATAGTMAGTASALLADCRPGDTTLLPEPFFIGHRYLLEALGFDAQYIPVPLTKAPKWEKLKSHMKDAKAFILTTPANPTGQVVPPEILKQLSEAAIEYDCLLIIDEMYREFVWGNEPGNDNAYQNLNLEKAVLLRSFSKTFAIPGWRVGFAVTSPERVERMAVTHDALYIGGSTIAQHAVAETLRVNSKELNEYFEDLKDLMQANRQILADAFKTYGMNPLPVTATYYMLIKHNRGSDIAAMQELAEKKIIVTPVNILYSDSSKDTGYIRIHFAVSKETTAYVSEILAG